jgi:16S rRNA (cytosine1402-N4)-methyltransferase
MHIPVLLKETSELLDVREGGKYIDATLGLGGHSLEILKRGGRVLGIDADEGSLEEARGLVKSAVPSAHATSKIQLVQGNFKDIKKIASENDFVPCDGVLFDLGMSSWQLERSGRGFSFQRDEPLDMRMDKSLAVTAADLLNGLNSYELEKLFKKYGEEQSAGRIASAVARARSLNPLKKTGDLVKIVEGVKGGRGKLHPATKVFQALRIAVNDEINNLRSALPQAFEVLRRPASTRGAFRREAGGRLAVISFHSLEDREVKRFFKDLGRAGAGSAVTEKPVTPSAGEIKKNPRARSAKLRVIEKRKSDGKNEEREGKK